MEEKKVLSLHNVSTAICTVFKIFFITYPLLVIAFWLGWITPPEYFPVVRLPVDVDLQTIRLSLRMYSALIDMIRVILVLAGYYYVVKLFQLYSQNIIFSLRNVIYIRKIGLMLLFTAIANILVQPFLSLILTFDAPKGEHVISVGLASDDLSTCIIGIVVIAVSWVMEEGRRLEEEQALTV